MYIIYIVYNVYMTYKPDPFVSIAIYHDRRIKLNTIRMVNGKYKMHPDSFDWLDKALKKHNGRTREFEKRFLLGEFQVEAKPMKMIKVGGLS